MHRKIHRWPNYISKIGVEPLMAFPRAHSCAIYCQTRAKRNQNDLELPSSSLFCSFHLSWYFFVKRAWMFWSSRIHEKVRFLKKDHQNGKRPLASPIVPRKAERTTSALLCKRAHFCAKARTSEKCAFSTLSFHQLQTESSTFLTNVRYFCNEQFLPKRAQKKTSRKECSLEASGRFIHVRSRKLAPACPSLESRRGSKLMRFSNPSSALAPLKWRN